MGFKASKKAGPIVMRVPRIEQPDEVTCGPTCLAQVYDYYGLDKPLDRVIEETPKNPDGGTLGAFLGISALKNGLSVQLYSYNLRVFDPTWRKLDTPALLEKLAKRKAVVRSDRLQRAIAGYMDFLELGGEVRFAELTERTLTRIITRRRPIITGLNATHLYRTPRELGEEYDDIRGHPVGHFVVLSGYYPKTGRFLVRDPSTHIPFSSSGTYLVRAERLIAAILLGDITYDAVLLVVSPGKSKKSARLKKRRG